jgi:uncharacterized small protein (DUF1192 family)
MKKQPNPFSRALTEATRNLAVAIKQRTAAQARVAELDAQIPALQQTIQALQAQLGQKGVMPNGRETLPHTSVTTGEHRAVTSADKNDVEVATKAGVPLELARTLPKSNLSGISSIPAKSGPKVERELTEDECLELGDIK